MQSTKKSLISTTIILFAVATFADCGLALTREEAIAVLKPYDGPAAAGVDCSTMDGKVLCGYQGWFCAKGDDSGKGFTHYDRRGKFEPGSCCIDYWPDVSELGSDEKFATPFVHADGSTAYVFSADVGKTVLRHFEWMKQYGIDGAFVQRFIVDTGSPAGLRHCNVVLDHVREGANRSGRAYAVMYDLSGLGAGRIDLVINDWKMLVDRMKLTRDTGDHAYLHHNGKPVVVIWGIGFNDGRRYTLDECLRLINFLKTDETYGGCTVMIGVPTGWRTQDMDCIRDPGLDAVLAAADVITPWTVGRYRTPQQAAKHGTMRWAPDIKWCSEHSKGYLPVIFPGFSWHNMNPQSPSDLIPRLKGEFFWSQVVAAKKAGATSLYVAMFDEMNEGTAIFKCTNDPPSGASTFLTLEGMPTDQYLWLAGKASEAIRGDLKGDGEMPKRP